MITGIVVALRDELSSLSSKKLKKGDWVFLSDTHILAYSGAGESNARTAAELLLAQGATRLISWGCAAALSETLKPGDLVLADMLIAADGVRIDIGSDWHGYAINLLSTILKVHTGSLVESKSIVTNGSDKKNLHDQTGAVALDMESIAIAKVAKQNGQDFLAIRAIADPANMNLPKAITYSLDKEGDINLTKLLLFIVLHPVEILGLIKLGLHFHAAKNTLKRVAKNLDSLTIDSQINNFEANG